MPDASDAELLRDLARLRGAYLRKLPARLGELEAHVRAARLGDDRDALASARDLAHTLKGSSGSYGLGAISTGLEAIEDDLHRRLEEPSRRDGWHDLERALERLREQLAAEDPAAS